MVLPRTKRVHSREVNIVVGAWPAANPDVWDIDAEMILSDLSHFRPLGSVLDNTEDAEQGPYCERCVQPVLVRPGLAKTQDQVVPTSHNGERGHDDVADEK